MFKTPQSFGPLQVRVGRLFDPTPLAGHTSSPSPLSMAFDLGACRINSQSQYGEYNSRYLDVGFL